MSRRRKFAISLLWLPIMMLMIGSAFLSIPITVLIHSKGIGDIQETLIIFLAFGIVGFLMTSGSIITLVRQIRKRIRRRRLKAEFEPAWLPVFSVDYVQNVRINGIRPLLLTCQTVQPNSDIYILKSDYLRYDPLPYLESNCVLVYMDPDNPKNYYIDVDQSVPNQVYEL